MKRDEITGQSTVVARTGDKKEKSDFSRAMTFTAVSSNQVLAETFVKELLRLARDIMTERDLSVDDLISICHKAQEKKDQGTTVLEGKHLRGRIGEQLCRAERYQEFFSLLVLGLDSVKNMNDYDTVADSLCERMRKTDLMFLFKSRIVLILPHTNREACYMLTHRISALVGPDLNKKIEFSFATYPGEEFEQSTDVLDWVEDKIRT